MAFGIIFSPRARENLKALRKRDQQILHDAIAVQLCDQPDRPTRHRKRLEENLLAPWELRVGDFRVFFDVDTANERVVIVAVGHKVHNRLWVGDEEIQL
jgi:mRNA-degrading endonuclease RelE of RelBE toxin-antitoxin system